MQRILLFSLCCLALSRGQVIILPDGTLAQWPPVQHPIHQIPIQQIPIQQIPIQQYPIQQLPIQPIPIQPIQVQGVEDDTYDAKVGEFPYQVSILVDGHHICGGSLISKKHVLTAAHCTHPLIVARKDKNTIKVLVGTNNLQRGGTYMDVDRVSEHGQFRPPSEVAPIMLNDIAVIRLKEEVVESDTVKVIGLPAPQQEVADNTQLILSGFGASYLNGPISVKLRKIQMLATNHQTCAVNWSNRGSITTGHLCASFGKGFGACQGDSGGPLTLADKSVVVGVVSEGIGLGCDSGWPDLYTKVSHYLDYINSELALTS